MDTERTITLNEIEQALAKTVASKRFEYNRKVGATATVYGGRDPLEAEVSQYGAELAFCKLHNIYPDTGYTVHQPEDCITLLGHRIDVKCTRFPHGKLMAKLKRWDNPPDYFALMIGVFPSYFFAGFMSAAELLRPERIDNSLEHPAYVATQLELKMTE